MLALVPGSVRVAPPDLAPRQGASPIQAAHRTSGTTARSTIEGFEDNIMPAETSTTDHELSTRRLNVMRLGYAFMAVGLAIVKWPILVQNAASLPVFAGVVACLLTAMSLLSFLGLRYPVRMLPILLFEVLWKVIWIAAVALPHLVADDIDAATSAVLFDCSPVVMRIVSMR